MVDGHTEPMELISGDKGAGCRSRSQQPLVGSMGRLLTTDTQAHTVPLSHARTHTHMQMNTHKRRAIDVKLSGNTLASGVAKQFN